MCGMWSGCRAATPGTPCRCRTIPGRRTTAARSADGHWLSLIHILTSRELEKAVKERDEALHAAEAARAAAETADQSRAKMEADMTALKQLHQAAQAGETQDVYKRQGPRITKAKSNHGNTNNCKRPSQPLQKCTVKIGVVHNKFRPLLKIQFCGQVAVRIPADSLAHKGHSYTEMLRQRREICISAVSYTHLAAYMKLQFLGHACFLLDDGVHKVLTDPFLTGAGRPEWAEKVDPDVIFVTHGHGDHVGDAAAIARRTGAPVCCTADLADAVFVPAGVACVAGNLGGTVRLSFGCAKFFQALHGGGAAGCPACGFLFEMGGRKIYHAGDTALMTDMTLLADEDIDVALLPIGDFYTMGPADALRAVKLIRPRLTVPMHYNTCLLYTSVFRREAAASGRRLPS